jgi:hypothetical protein
MVLVQVLVPLLLVMPALVLLVLVQVLELVRCTPKYARQRQRLRSSCLVQPGSSAR